MTSAAPSTRAILRIGVLDAPFEVLIPPLIAVTLMTDHAFAIGVFNAIAGLVRQATWIAYLRRDLGSVDRIARTSPRLLRDADLVEAVRDLRAAFDRFPVVYCTGWAGLIIATVLYAMTLDPGASRERLVLPCVLITTTCVCAGGVFSFTQGRIRMTELGMSLFEESERRGLGLVVPTGSIRVRVAVTAIAIAIAPLGWLGEIGLRAADVSAENEARLSARAEALATLVDGGTREGLRTLPSARSAPAEVVAWAARGGEGSRVDAVGRRVYVLVRARDSRAVLAARPISSAGADSFLVATAGFLLAAIVWALICALAFGRDLGEGVGRVTAEVGRLLDVGDLSAMKPIPVVIDDEIGALTRDFNALVQSLRTLARGADQVARGDLEGTIDGRGELNDAFRGMLESLRSVVGRVRRTAVELASAAAEIYSASQEQEAAATQQSTGITEVSRTMASLAGSAAHIAEAVGTVLGDAERTRATTEQMTARIGELNAHASRIGELLEVIREVADRSDLLALNGSLEATRVGDSGKGFALVAGEMRRLAERVTATVGDVRALVADVHASGSATVMATEQSRKLAESTTDSARRIALVAQQQRTATEQVTTSVRDVADVLAQAAVATTQTRVSAESLKSQADELESLLTRFRVVDTGMAA